MRGNNEEKVLHIPLLENESITFGNVSKNISTIAASLYSLKASAFLAICSASALAFASIANASASPLS